MNVNVEALVIGWGNSTDLLDAPFSAAVPTNRPERFFTVERTGGGVEQFRDLPTVAVQAWAASTAQASRLIQDFAKAAWDDLQQQPNVARVSINTISHFPGSNGEPRYQAVVQLVTA